jgi:tetratricopeptide (TPR) repeat protein
MVASLATALALLLVGSVIGLTALYLKADLQRRRAEEAEASWKTAAALAQQGQAKARQSETKALQSEKESKAVMGFFEDHVLAAARPKGWEGGLGHEITIQAAVDRAEPLIAKTFEGQPLVEASIREALGNTYLGLSEHHKAMQQHQRALALRKAHLDPHDPEVLSSMASLAIDYHNAGRLDEALKLHQETLELRKAVLGADHPRTVIEMNRLADTLLAAGRLPEAIPLYEESLRRWKATHGPHDHGTLYYMNTLANAYRGAGRLTEATPLLETALQELQSDPNHLDTLNTMNNLAATYFDLRRLTEALSLWEETLKRARASFVPDSGLTLNVMNNVAAGYRELGRTKEAVPLFEEAYRLTKAKYGQDNALVPAANLAGAYREIGRLSEALTLYQDTLRISKTKLGADHPTRLNIMNLAGQCLLKMKKFDDAVVLLRECLNLRSHRNPEDWWVYHTKSQLGQALTGLHKYSEAEALLLEAQRKLADRQAKIPARYHRHIADAGQALVDLYEASGNSVQADAWRKKISASKPKP